MNNYLSFFSVEHERELWEIDFLHDRNHYVENRKESEAQTSAVNQKTHTLFAFQSSTFFAIAKHCRK